MSDLKTWLSQERGRSKALAARLGVSKSRMSQMVSGGVPREHLIAVRDFTNGEVTLEALLTQPVHTQQEAAHA
ncbi:YdaS family helix-turn-helix protein [Comamonas sp.]|uniref:YdaS family helix-turn-helix protein n=1 Tax=Comamonas sp. TaxID=34028 RepID=UPI00345C0E46